MIRGFWQSKLAFAGICVLTLGLAVAIWIRDQGYEIYIPVIASLLMLGIGFIAARLVGNVIANQQNTKLLGILHVDLDPEKFVKLYRPVVNALNPASRDYAIACTYLADGYAAAEEYDKAVDTLCPRFEGKKGDDYAMMGLYYSNLCAYALGKEQLEQAAEAMEHLQSVIDICGAGNPALANNLSNSLRLHKNRVAALNGGRVETGWLKEMHQDAQYVLRRLEISKTLAMDAVNRGDRAAAGEHLKQIHREAGRSCYQSWASRLENRLNGKK